MIELSKKIFMSMYMKFVRRGNIYC